MDIGRIHQTVYCALRFTYLNQCFPVLISG
jgi:hypothetical protein